MSKWYILGWPALNPITDISKYHKLGNLNNKNLFSYTSRGWKSKTRVQHGWILVRTPFLLENLFNVVTYPFLPVCQWTEKGLYFSLFRGPPILAALNLKLMMLLHLCYFPKAQSPKTVPVEMRVLTYEVCGGSLVIKSCLIPVTPWTAVHQAPLSMGFSWQRYWTGLPFPSSEDLSHPRIKPSSPALQMAGSLPTRFNSEHSTIMTHGTLYTVPLFGETSRKFIGDGYRIKWKKLFNSVLSHFSCVWLGSSIHGIPSPGKNTGVGSHFLTQGIFLTQRSRLLHWHADSLPLSHLSSCS